MAASVAIGAPNLTGTWSGIPLNGSSFRPDPEGSCMGASGDLWVPDFGGSRVLEFQPPFTFKEVASVILGQTSSTGYIGNATQSGLDEPAFCTVDSQGDLWVSDFANARVLEFVPPFTNGSNANLVLGQSSFTGDASGVSAVNLSLPVGLTFDAKGDLWVADSGNNRVVEYVPPFSDGMAASLVIGQNSFTTDAYGTNASMLNYPIDVAFSTSGILWVADYLNNRVLGFSAPFSTGEGATYVLGQSTFIGSTGAVSAKNLSGPSSVFVDSRGNLWVSETENNRVVEFLPPFSTSESASIAIGQDSLTTSTFGTSATALSYPIGAFVAPNGDLWVSDSDNNRVVEYVPNVYQLSFVASGVPSTFHWSVTVGSKLLSGSGTNLSTTEVNGSYSWSISPVHGYSISPTNGTAVVNGASASVSITVTQLTYTITFAALGLPASSSWSVTFDSVTHTSVSNGSILFTEADGTYTYVVVNVSGYSITPTHGSVVVNGTNESVFVAFASTSSSSSSSSTSTLELVLFAVVALIIGLVVGLLLGRRRGKAGASAPAAAWSPPPSGPGTPPSGANPPPPPPGAGGPPPGASG